MTIRLTDEERARLASAMVDTWQAIAPDIHDCFAFDARESGKRKHVSASALVELVCDANRMETFGGITKEEAAVLSKVYSTPSFQKWARSVMRGYKFSVDPPPKPPKHRPFRVRSRSAPRPTQTYWKKAGYTTWTGTAKKPKRIHVPR